MTKTESTRSVHFATTSQSILLPNAGLTWYSEADNAEFRRETLQHAKQLRAVLALSSEDPADLPEDVLTNCTGIEDLVHCPRSLLRQQHEMKLAHVVGILAAQRYLSPADLSLVSQRSSFGNRQRAYDVASV